MEFTAAKKSIDAFKKLPGMGARHATRCVFYLLKTGENDFKEFISSLVSARSSSMLCGVCFRLFEIRGEEKTKLSRETKCDICSDTRRIHETIMVVENDQDLIVMERLNTYRGTYLVLRNIAGKKEARDGRPDLVNEENILQISQNLKERSVREMILATNPTVEGNSFAFRIKTGFGDAPIKITRLARGLPTGAEIEYADEETLREALEARK